MNEREPCTLKIDIKLFGAMELSNVHGLISENRSRQSRPWLLLKYLLVNRGREVEQGEVLEMVWTDAGDKEGGNASRVRLKRLRESLAPLGLDGVQGLILFSKGEYSFNPAYELVTDADEFLELRERGRGYPMAEPEGLKCCTKALELFRGQYMEYADAPWLEKPRIFYRNRFKELALETLERSKALDEDGALQLLSQRAAAILPEDEALHRQMISYLTEKRKELCLVRYITLLSRNGAGAKWLNEMEL